MDQTGLFDGEEIYETPPSSEIKNIPLAARMRPRVLDEFIGQKDLMGRGKLLERLIRTDSFSSLIFYGPPGTGKTTLANIIAQETRRRFVPLSAVTSNVSEVRKVVEDARLFNRRGQKTILFVDEIHRFNKAQQDILLPHIENGTISFIGATTQNPFFSIVSPLVSRSQVFRLKALEIDEIKIILQKAVQDSERGLGKETIKLAEKTLEDLAMFSEGDARRALNTLELALQVAVKNERGEHEITHEVILQALQEKPMRYDRNEDQHYDTISAFIKSVRGSDPDAALYWLAKMIHGGEDILFIARRLVILASEDIGNADPQALQIATSALAAVEFVGLPEARIPLAQVTIYLACAPKSNASYVAIERALESLKTGRVQEVPEHLKNVKTDDPLEGTIPKGTIKGLVPQGLLKPVKTCEKNESRYEAIHGGDSVDTSPGTGAPAPEDRGTHGRKSVELQQYQYPHNYEGHFIEQAYLKKPVSFLQLSDSGYEVEMAKRLKAWRERKEKMMEEEPFSGQENS